MHFLQKRDIHTDGRTDRRTDRRTDTHSYRDARTHLKSLSYLDGGEFEKVEKADVRLVVKDQISSVEGNVFDPARIIAGESTTLDAAYRLLFANVVEGDDPVGEA